MGFLHRIFGLGKQKENSAPPYNPTPKPQPIPRNENVIKLLEFKRMMEGILQENQYIAKSGYIDKVLKFDPVFKVFDALKSSDMIGDFCKINGISERDAYFAMDLYTNTSAYIDKHNDDYIAQAMEDEKEYLDNVLKAADPVVVLDEDQRRVILTDEDYCLVIAGAGAGKTTTVAAKVKYLVDKKGIDPSQILVVSFTNKAVNELKEKIQGALGIECPIATFHSTGNAIIHKHSPEEKLNIVDNSRLYFVIRDYFRGSVLQNETVVNKLIMFFATYFDAPYEGDDLNGFFNNIAKANYSTMRSDLEDFKREVIDARTKKSVTIRNEVLRSHQEVEIANFLYLNNIDYEYEPVYPYNILYARKPYTPDFIIAQGEKTAYIEHFGISESGENDRYSQEELNRYKQAVNDKVRLHKQHGTTLIYTFSGYEDCKPLLAHLREELEEKGFELHPRSNKEVMEMLVAGEENRYIRKFISLICRFISNFKVNGYTAEEFNRMYHSTQNVRSRLFLDICNDCYLEYERWLNENKAVDFEDMINESARILREVKEMKQKLDFKYIIVDEYQDISRQRFDLTKALSEVTDAKIIAVGDDWQSIYAFSGSDITLFTKFEEKMGYAKLLKIVKTYRNSQDVIDIAGNFIQKNTEQISKRLISPKHIEDPVIIYTYDSTSKGKDGNRRSGENYAIAHAVETALAQILEYKKAEGKKPGSILLLGRFGFDGDKLERSGLFEFISRGNRLKSVKYPNLDITFMTAHSSKGLGYDDVIIVNGKNETYGFPSKIEDDPVLAFVIKGDRSIDYAEERRLFYVAMTRTKNRVFFIAPEQNPSEFLLELKRDYKNVRLRGSWNEHEITRKTKKSCPLCGYPMQLKYKKAYGLRLYICSNEPEICGFMTNNLQGGKLAIQKCDNCRDGYLIVKSGKRDGFFLGCTNYKLNGTGCTKSIGKKYYYDLMGYEMEEEDGMPSAQRPPLEVAGRMPGAQRPPLESAGRMPGAQRPPLEPAGRMPSAQWPPLESAGRMPGAQRPQLEPAGRMPGAQQSPLEPAGRMPGAQRPQLEPAGRMPVAQRPQLEPAGRMPGAQRPPLESSGRMLGAQKLPLEPAGRTSTAQPPIEPEESESTPAIQSLIKPEEKANPVIFSEKLPDDYIEIQRADVKPVMYNGYDLNELIFTVVKTLQNVSRVRYYGAAMLNDVLRGTVTKRIIDSNLDKIPEFGILKEFQHETVRSIIEWMIKEHLILRTKERYPVLHSTYEGLHYSEKMTEGKLKKLKTYLEEGT